MRAADQILHVRARGPAPSRRVRAALGHVRLSPPGLSPSAVLLVRRLGEDLPGVPSGSTRIPRQWEHAAREAIAQARHRAVRPRGGRISASAEAVLFADEAEWRASTALALVRQTRPWWTSALGPASVAPLLADAPRLLPALLDHLTAWGVAPRVLADLSASEADALTDLACDAAGLDTPTRGARTLALRPAAHPLPWAASGTLAVTVAHVDAWVGREHAVLVGMGGVLARSPGQLRRPEAIAAVATWRAQGIRAAVSAEPPDQLTSGLNTDTSPATNSPSETDRTVDEQPGPRPQSPPVTPPREPTASIDARAPTPFPPDPLAPSSSVGSAFPRPASEPRTPSSSEAAAASDTPWAEGTATRLGGAFFLLPIMRAFGWPEAAEETWRLASATGTWGALEALARGLLDGAHGDDPLWRLLAHLDGREPDTPPRDAVAEKAELSTSVPDLPPVLAAWVHTVLPDVEARLVDALDLDDAELIPGAVLRREATIYATRSHVDVVLPLASATLAVRRAGLDADPGWTSSAGRVVQFHYR